MNSRDFFGPLKGPFQTVSVTFSLIFVFALTALSCYPKAPKASDSATKSNTEESSKFLDSANALLKKFGSSPESRKKYESFAVAVGLKDPKLVTFLLKENVNIVQRIDNKFEKAFTFEIDAPLPGFPRLRLDLSYVEKSDKLEASFVAAGRDGPHPERSKVESDALNAFALDEVPFVMIGSPRITAPYISQGLEALRKFGTSTICNK